MSEDTLFELPAAEAGPPGSPTQPEQARVVRPVREQLQWVARDLEASVAQDHPARAIWGAVGGVGLVGLLWFDQGGGRAPWSPNDGSPGTSGPVAFGDSGWGGERPASGPPVRGARRLSLGLRWGAHQLPHVVGLSGGPPGCPGRVADPDRGLVDGRRCGDPGTGGARWGEGAGQRRSLFLPSTAGAGCLPEGGAGPGGTAGLGAGASRPRGKQTTTECAGASGP